MKDSNQIHDGSAIRSVFKVSRVVTCALIINFILVTLPTALALTFASPEARGSTLDFWLPKVAITFIFTAHILTICAVTAIPILIYFYHEALKERNQA